MNVIPKNEHWCEVSAPSNIALIKYMGKVDRQNNVPTNSSLSWTLENLRTVVRIRKDEHLFQDEWSQLQREGFIPLQLSQKGKDKFLNFFSVLKKEFGLEGYFHIQSGNNFPSDCGLASSASSFAALTACVSQFALLKSKPGSKPAKSITELAALSRRGSGSSCRSFFSPWALWDENGAREIELPYSELRHLVVLCDEQVKKVSSSEAHVRVLTSDMFAGRAERAQKRLNDLVEALKNQNWKKAYQICWNEFWDMHVLFHTSDPAFMYINYEGYRVLMALHDYWMSHDDGPLVTMDAGSNIHLLFRHDQLAIYQEMKKTFSQSHHLWSDEGYLQRGPVNGNIS